MSVPTKYLVSVPRLAYSTGSTFTIGIGFSDDALGGFDRLIPFNGAPWQGATIATLATISAGDTVDVDVYSVRRNESPAGGPWAAVVHDVALATVQYTDTASGVWQLMTFASAPAPIVAGTERILSPVPSEWAIVYTFAGTGTIAVRGTIHSNGGLMGGSNA